MSVGQLKAQTKGIISYIWAHREVVLLLTIAILIYFLAREGRTPTSSSNTSTDPLLLKQVAQLKDENGKYYAVIQQQQLAASQTVNIIDSLGRLLKVKPKYIKGATVYVKRDSIVFKDTGRIVIIGVDTAIQFGKQDKWITARVQVFPSKPWMDNLFLMHRDSLITVITHKQPLFGRPTDQVLIHSASPYSSITQGASFTIKEKQPFIDLGVGGYWNPFTNKFGPMVYIGIPVIHLIKR